MKIKFLIIQFLIGLGYSGISQIPTECIYNCCVNYPEEESSSPLKSYSMSDYILHQPESNSSTIIIRVNVFILQRNDGTGNFQESNSEHQDLLSDLYNEINNVYGNFIDPSKTNCYTGTDFIPDSKIYFDFHNYYIKDNFGWNNGNDSDPYNCPAWPDDYSYWYLNAIDSSNVNNTAIPRGINLYFTEDSTNYFDLVVNRTTNEFNGTGIACSQYPSDRNFQRTSKLHVLDIYSKFWWMKNIKSTEGIGSNNWNTIRVWWYLKPLAKAIAHELGHSINLYHNCYYYPRDGCHESLMCTLGNKPRNYLPPTEVGKAHFAFSTTNIRTFIHEDFYNPNPLNYSDNTTWDFEYRSYRDISLVSGSKLILTKRLIMPSNASITINTDSELILDGVAIEGYRDSWKGIIVENGGVLNIKNVSIEDFPIIVESGGTLVVSGNVIVENKGQIFVKKGGYLCYNPNTVLHLDNVLNTINLYPGFHMGLNPILTGSYSCTGLISAMIFTGSGSINRFLSDIYIQNETISGDRYIAGKNIYIGSNVTTTKPNGNVLISSGSNVTLDAAEMIIFEKNIDFNSGAKVIFNPVK